MAETESPPKIEEPRAAAIERIIDVPELFETVLLLLSMQDLLVNAQRVNHRWRDAIEGSPAIQQALFFRGKQNVPRGKIQSNPLLQRKFINFFVVPEPERGIQAESFTTIEWNDSDETRDAFARERASWRRMLPRQPAARFLRVVETNFFQGGKRRIEGLREFNDGVRMGALYDLAEERIGRRITVIKFDWVSPPAGQGEQQVKNDTDADRDVADDGVDTITMNINCTKQCIRGRGRLLGPEFKSKDYEEYTIPE